MTWNPEFEAAFSPTTIAVVGASRKPVLFGDFVANLQRAGFPGRIYPINPKAVGEEIHGLKAYPDLASVPEPIDLVTIAVPSHAVLDALEDCIAANAKNIQIYTAGFKESGGREGLEMEERLKEVAARGGLRIVGPNCMGLHIPSARITTWGTLDHESGPVAFLAQSGGHAGIFALEAPSYGLKLSKMVSYGNAAVIDSVDFLEYLATDPQTEIICLYLEGVRDGRRLTTLVREINKTKPVIIWKGGNTDSGARAAASHTGSLGGQREVWDAFFKQTGAVSVDGLDELLDMAMTFRYLRPPSGNRVSFVGGGGGNSVAAADICDRAGLEMPPFNQETLRELASFIPPEGAIIKNPIDIALIMLQLDVLVRAMECAATDPSVDAVIYGLPPGLLLLGSDIRSLEDTPEFRASVERQTKRVLDPLIKFNDENPQGKPLVIVLQPGLLNFLPGQREKLRLELLKAGIVTYFSLEQASRAMGKLVRYHQFHSAEAD